MGSCSRIFVVTIVLLILAGCTQAEPMNNTTTKLKIQYPWDESIFYLTYGDMFAMKYPNVEIEVVSSQSGSGSTEVEQPDVYILDQSSYEDFTSQGKLLALDPLITRDKYDIEGIYPAIIDILKERGDGNLYGLSPHFDTSVVYYNVDLFHKYQVDVPQEGVSWWEILQLASKFPSDGDDASRIYGLSMGNSPITPAYLTTFLIGQTDGLQIFNKNTMKMTMDTEAWRRTYQLALDAIRSGSLYNPSSPFTGGSREESFQSKPFLVGRSAMTIGGPYLLQELKEIEMSSVDSQPFQIGVVAGPVDAKTREMSRGIVVREIFSISASSPVSDVAWEFVKYINGDEFAKAKSRLINGNLLSRVGYMEGIKGINGLNINAFYKLKPILDKHFRSGSLPSSLYTLIERESDLVLTDKKSIDGAILTIQNEGQVLLDQMAKEKDASNE